LAATALAFTLGAPASVFSQSHGPKSDPCAGLRGWNYSQCLEVRAFFRAARRWRAREIEEDIRIWEAAYSSAQSPTERALVGLGRAGGRGGLRRAGGAAPVLRPGDGGPGRGAKAQPRPPRAHRHSGDSTANGGDAVHSIQYVRVCSLYGAGFYYVPGTDTCV